MLLIQPLAHILPPGIEMHGFQGRGQHAVDAVPEFGGWESGVDAGVGSTGIAAADDRLGINTALSLRRGVLVEGAKDDCFPPSFSA